MREVAALLLLLLSARGGGAASVVIGGLVGVGGRGDEGLGDRSHFCGRIDRIGVAG